jgi:hypothetical protein
LRGKRRRQRQQKLRHEEREEEEQEEQEEQEQEEQEEGFTRRLHPQERKIMVLEPVISMGAAAPWRLSGMSPRDKAPLLEKPRLVLALGGCQRERGPGEQRVGK